MKIFSILLLAILGAAMTVLAAPAPGPEAEPKPVPKPVARPKPFPGELAMVEARGVFEGGHRATGADGDDGDDGPDSVEPTEKVSLNPRDTGTLFNKRQSCATNYWYCSQINGCCQRSPEYRCCDFGCCRPGYYCCGLDGRCWRSWLC